MKQAQFLVAALLALCCLASVLGKPLVPRPDSTRKYTTVLTIDGGGFKCMMPTIVAEEIEASIKRYLLAHPEYLPEDEDIETVDDFDILLADYFDAMAGVSAGSWTTGYLSSKGGNGAAQKVFRRRSIRRKYGSILPGAAKGLEVFFEEYGPNFYPSDTPLNRTGPAIPLNTTQLAQVNQTEAVANATALGQGALAFANASFIGLATGQANLSTVAAGATAIAQSDDVQQALQQLPQVEIPGVNAPFYSTEGLEEALDLFVGDTKLSELSTYYVVHAYDLNTRRNVYFIQDIFIDPSEQMTSSSLTRSRPRPVPDTNDLDDEDFVYMPDNDQTMGRDFYMKDVMRASSAVPGFHEAKVMSDLEEEETYSFIDGAMITNNPALQALIFLNSFPRLIPTENIAMISLGSGVVYNDLQDNIDASPLGWLINGELVSIMSEGSAENVQSQVDFLFYGNPNVQPNQYLRIQIGADRNTTEGDALSRFTNVDDLPTFKDIGERMAKRWRRSIDRFVNDFIFAEGEAFESAVVVEEEEPEDDDIVEDEEAEEEAEEDEEEG